jgi:hypothetical protein
MARPAEDELKALPEELISALRRAAGEALAAIESLRSAVRHHVHTHKARGESLSNIDTELCAMILDAAGDPRAAGYSRDRNEELTHQILKWSESDFSRGRPR